MTARRQRDRVLIRARTELTTEEMTPKLKPVRAKSREKPPEPVAPPDETPRPVPEALVAKDLVKVDDILSRPILTPREVGTLLRVSPRTVMNLVQDGDLPAMRVQKQTRLLRIDVLQFIRELRDEQERMRRYRESNREERLAEQGEEEAIT